jgi:hypothetical protein
VALVRVTCLPCCRDRRGGGVAASRLLEAIATIQKSSRAKPTFTRAPRHPESGAIAELVQRTGGHAT